MEPFSITCTTCQAKLKVRSAAAIGQILSCPKCESMVQVMPPPGWQADGAAPAEATNAPPSTIAATPRNPTPKPVAADPSIAAPSTTAAALAADELNSAVADAAAAFEDMSDLPVGTASPTPPPLELPPLSADWASPTETLWRKVAIYTVAGGTTAVVLSLAVSYFLAGSDPPAAPEQVAAADTELEKPVAETPAATGDEETVASDPATEETAEKKSEAPESLLPPAEKTDPEKPAATKEASPPAAEEPKAPDADSSSTPPDAAEDTATDATLTGTDTPPSSEKTETGSSVDAAALLADASFETLLPAEAPSPDAALTVPAKEMSQEELAAAAAAQSHEGEHSASNGEGAAPAASVRRIPHDSTAPLQPAEEVLRLQLPQLTFHSIPLAVLMGEISDLSTLPVSFDLTALNAAQISPHVPVSVSATDRTLAEILTTTLASQKLTYFTHGRQVIVTTPAAVAAPHTVRFTVDDLAAGEEKLQELAALIIKMVAPESWQFAGGPGKMQVETDRLSLEQSGSVIYEAVVFCERLRTARGLATRSRLPADELQLASARVQAKGHLDRNVSCTFHAPTRLVDVVRYLEELGGMKIFIDWRSLDQVQLGPQDTITCALREQPFASALDALLTPLALGYRVVDKSTLEVFALPDLPTKMTREFYSVKPLLASGLKPEVLLSGVRQLTGEEAWAPETTGFYYLDPASEHLIVRHGNTVHGQIEHLLGELARKIAGKKTAGGKG